MTPTPEERSEEVVEEIAKLVMEFRPVWKEEIAAAIRAHETAAYARALEQAAKRLEESAALHATNGEELLANVLRGEAAAIRQLKDTP